MKNTLRIMDLPTSERPQEKMFKYGAETLTNSELLALILRSGTSGENIISLCTRVLKESGGLNGLLNLRVEECTQLKGIKEAKAAQIMALAEISKRFKSYKAEDTYKISSPKDAAQLVMESMRYLNQEVLKVILLNTKNVVIGIKDVSMGSINSSIVHPREVFCEAVKRSCASIIVCHNHPSGDPTPSSEDINVTHRLKECGNLLGIELIDHLVIGNGIFISLKEKGIV
jgi:DNA repair protein RadC